MSYYSIIPFIAFLINFFLWSYIFATRRQNKASRAYLFFAGTIAFFEISEIALWSNLPDSTIAMLFKVLSPIHLSIGFLLLNFVFTLFDKKRNLFYYTILISYFIVLSIQMFSNLYIDSSGIVRYPWGTEAIHGPLFAPAVITLYLFPSIYSIYLIWIKRINSENTVEKKQLGLLIYGIIITIVLSNSINFILPYIGINNVPKLGSSFFAVMSIFIFIAIIKYKFLSHTIIDLAYDLFTLTNDSIIIFDNNKKIIDINKQAKELLNIQEVHFKNLSADDIFPEEYSFLNNYKEEKFELLIRDNKTFILLTQLPLEQANVFNGKLAIIKDITEIENTNRINKIQHELVFSLAKTTNLHNAYKMALDAAIEISGMDSGGIYTYDQSTMGYTLINSIGLSKEFTDKVSFFEKDSFQGKTITKGDPFFIDNINLTAFKKAGGPETSEGLQAAAILPIQHLNKTIACINISSHSSKSFSLQIKNSLINLTSQFASALARIKMEEELRKSSQVESLGIFAGGIAHDFNNILTGIMGNISIAILEIDKKHKSFETLKEAENAATRAKDLTRQLLTFSRGGAPVKKIVSLHELIEDTAKFVLRGSSVRCNFNFSETPWNCEIDEGQISQVIHNIVLNSLHAMPDGGTITIKTENVFVKSEENPFLNEGSYIKILIKDEGKGIPEEDLHRIFDPYFSKRDGGTGLGLTIAYSIIKNHEGYISVNSSVGKGTSISIFLPASQSELQEQEIKKIDTTNLTGRVIIMDDEEMILTLGKKMLEILGFEVETAEDGNQAIEIFKNSKSANKPINLAIIDLTIPGGMGGKETIEKLLKINPDLIAIVSSGYSDDPVISHFEKYGFKAFIQKPYKFDELKQVIHNLLAK